MILLPVVYLISTWKYIPAEIPLHYNLYGEADRWGSKNNLWWLLTVIPIGGYVILWAAKKIDPKKNLSQIGNKFYLLRFGFSLVLSIIFLSMLYSLKNDNNTFPSLIFIILASVFIFFGNYFRNMKPNYFLGFRTPWALENDHVWKQTHRHSSLIWFIGGVLMLILNLLKPLNELGWVNASIIGILIIDPIIYSYIVYTRLSKPGQ